MYSEVMLSLIACCPLVTETSGSLLCSFCDIYKADLQKYFRSCRTDISGLEYFLPCWFTIISVVFLNAFIMFACDLLYYLVLQ